MDAQTVQEYNGETGKWDVVPPAVMPTETPAPVETETPDEPVTPSKAATPETPDVAWEGRRPTNAEARKNPQARLDQKTWDQRDAERRATDAERRASDAERRAQDAERRTAPKPEPVTEKTEKFPAFAAYVQTHPDASLEDYMDARDEWKDQRHEAKVAAAKTAETETAQERANKQTFETKAAAFGDLYAKALDAEPDLEQHIDKRLMSVVPLSLLTKEEKAQLARLPERERDEWAFRCWLADHWVNRPEGVAILKYASKNFQRLATLPPSDVLWELARLESGTGAASPKTGSAPIPKSTTSQVEPPIKPVGSSPHMPDADPSDEDDDETWRKKEEARLLRQRRGRG